MPEEIDDFEELDDEPDFEETSGNTSPNNDEKNGDNTIPSSRKEDNKNETVDTSSETTSNTNNVVDFPGNPNAENQNINAQNPEDGYQKASSGREAYQRQINDKNYYNKQQQDAEQRKNTVADKLDKNEKKQDESQKRLEEVQRKKQQRKDSGSDNRTKDEKKEDKKEEKEAKAENKELKKEQKELQSQKNKADLDLKSIAKDKKKAAAFAALHPVQAAQMGLEVLLKKAGKAILMWLISGLTPIIIGGLILFFIVYLIMGPLMEVYQYIDSALTKVADFQENLTNFYNGFGFQDSKEAFFDEVDDLKERYGDGLDIPLILSTLFYTEGMGGDTAFDEIEGSEAIDQTIGEASNSGIFTAIRGYMRDKFDEAQQTVDENGLIYNTGKIYRLRKLARNQFHTNIFGVAGREGPTQTISLGDFITKYGKYIAKDYLEYLSKLLTTAWNVISAPFKELWALIVGSEYSGSFFDNVGNAASEFVAAWQTLISDIVFGILDVTDVDVKVFGDDGFLTVNIKYKTYVFDKDNYDNYLKDYYFEHMPEYKSMLPDDASAREKAKEDFIVDIYANRDMFVEIFLEEEEGDVEEYQNNCIGSISNSVINGLRLPVDAPEGKEIKFESPYSFGMRNGVNHNGVDINGATVGVGEGDPVYAVADGVVTNSLPNVTCNSQQDSSCKTTQGAWVRIKHTIVEDNKEYTFFSVYMHLQTNSGQPAVDSVVKQGDVIGHIGNTGDSSGPHLHFEIREEDGSANGKALDPTNLFVKCNSVSNDADAKIVTIPADVLQLAQMNYTVTCYGTGGWYLGCGTSPTAIASSSYQKKVHELWVAGGARYTNGIAVLNVEGVDRYLVATTSTLGNVGDLINAKLADGNVLPLLIADQKSSGDANWTLYGHMSGSSLSVLEFEVDASKYRSIGSNPSSWGQDWDTTQKVIEVAINHSILN